MTSDDRDPLLTDERLYAERLVEAVQDVVYVFDAEGTLVEYNDKLLEVTGYEAETVASMAPWEFFPADEREAIADAVARVLDGERVRVEAHYLTSEDEAIPYEFTGSPLYDSDDEVVGFVGIGRDISERKRREQELREREEKYQRLTERISEAYYAFDSEWRVTYWNETVARRQGVPAEEILGKNIWEEYPEMKGTVYEETLRTAMATNEPQSCELYYEPDDYWVKVQAYPDEDGVAVLSTDVTERKEREERLRTTSRQLEVLNRLLRHDIRNDIDVILGWAQLLREDVPEEHDRTVRELLAAADHIRDLTENSRALMEIVTTEAEVDTHPVRLDEVLTTEIEKVRARYERVGIEVEEPLPAVLVRANELLHSVFRNLLNNAVQHAGDRPTVEVTVERDDDAVRVTVADDGPGVDDDRKEAIFGKGNQGLGSEGTGIGLYLVARLVENYGGEAWVEDADPSGAAFVVELPAGGDGAR